VKRKGSGSLSFWAGNGAPRFDSFDSFDCFLIEALFQRPNDLDVAPFHLPHRACDNAALLLRLAALDWERLAAPRRSGLDIAAKGIISSIGSAIDSSWPNRPWVVYDATFKIGACKIEALPFAGIQCTPRLSLNLLTTSNPLSRRAA
jgi:hypothetical protein